MTDQDTSSSFDIFCEKCDNILDITRTMPIKNNEEIDTDTDTPKNLSSDEEEEEIKNQNVDYETLLKKVEAGKKLSYDELSSINIKDLVKNDYYKKMAKKGEIKKNIIDMIDEMGNTDENVQAYLICKNCGFSKTIEAGLRILSKNPEGVISGHDYINEANYRNKVHIRTMPITRNFKCTNKDCPVYKEGLAPEAIFFRKNNTTHQIIYVCKHCLTIKMN
jgi:hypothetical protein